LPARSATPTVLHRDIDEIAVKIGELYAKERPTPAPRHRSAEAMAVLARVVKELLRVEVTRNVLQ